MPVPPFRKNRVACPSGTSLRSAMTREQIDPDYLRVQKAIRFISEGFRDQPTLDDVATHVGLSPYHLQRLFTRWAGVSPKRFLQYVTLEHAKRLLRESSTVLEASWDTGLSGPGRLHDLTVALEGVTPGEHRTGGQGLRIGWGVHPTPFGPALLAVTERGLTALSFLPPEGPGPLVEELGRLWHGAVVEEAAHRTAPVAKGIFGPTEVASSPTGSPVLQPPTDGSPSTLRLHVRGTNFQIRVWEALLRVPPGRAVTYSDLAEAVGRPGAARAVGHAMGKNPIALVIPCHRVLRRNGVLGGYRWGAARKRALLGWESALLPVGEEFTAQRDRDAG